jgi:hypothetical protein
MSNELKINFANGASLSTEAIDVDSIDKLIGIFVKTGFTGTVITFEAYDNDDNAYSVTDLSGAELSITLAIGYFPLDPAIFAGLNKVKVRRGTFASPFTTGADATMTVVRREY